MSAFPQSFDSIWAAMALMVLVLVIFGMIMDAFGAVILVSATMASIAYGSGIHPVHFWMVTLVAFELGYLSPPVALNHLLTRQVVGESELLAAQSEEGTFYQRHERIILPLIAMGISLILVAFVPLIFYG
jgi:TRAP-type C4-dicarboxylate transport system permease large subunit